MKIKFNDLEDKKFTDQENEILAKLQKDGLSIIQEMKPVQFLPYAHTVTDRIMSLGDDSEFYKSTEKELVDQFNKAGIKAYPDNKLVFVLEMQSGQKICVGFYDWVMNIGFGYRKV